MAGEEHPIGEWFPEQIVAVAAGEVGFGRRVEAVGPTRQIHRIVDRCGRRQRLGVVASFVAEEQASADVLEEQAPSDRS